MIRNICIRESYKNKDGVEKTSWNCVGTLIDGKEGKLYVKMFHMPGVLMSVFEPKPKADAPKIQRNQGTDELGF